MFVTVICAAASFLTGSIPFGVLAARSRGVDIMSVGSGNTGTTNVWRTLGWKVGLPVFILDVLKGFAPTLVSANLLGKPENGLLIGLLAVLGHSFSPWIGFKGGKGIASGLGVLLAAAPAAAGIAFGVFAIVLAITRYVSLASMIACVALLVAGFVQHLSPTFLIAFGAFTLFVFVRHRANIQRLMAGTENRIGSKKSGPNHAAVTLEPDPQPTEPKA